MGRKRQSAAACRRTILACDLTLQPASQLGHGMIRYSQWFSMWSSTRWRGRISLQPFTECGHDPPCIVGHPSRCVSRSFKRMLAPHPPSKRSPGQLQGRYGHVASCSIRRRCATLSAHPSPLCVRSRRSTIPVSLSPTPCTSVSPIPLVHEDAKAGTLSLLLFLPLSLSVLSSLCMSVKESDAAKEHRTSL